MTHGSEGGTGNDWKFWAFHGHGAVVRNMVIAILRLAGTSWISLVLSLPPSNSKRVTSARSPRQLKYCAQNLIFFFLWLPRPVKTAMVFPVKENGVENGSLRQKGLWSRERCCRDLCCTWSLLRPKLTWTWDSLKASYPPRSRDFLWLLYYLVPPFSTL